MRIILIASLICGLFGCNQAEKTTAESGSKPAERTHPKKQKPFTAQEGKILAQPVNPDTPAKPQDLKLFDIGIYEIKPKWSTGFISLSDVFQSDSAAIPDLSEKEFKDVQYLKLTTKFRKAFLAGTKISETDTIFLYDNAANVHASFPVKSQGVIAIPSVYKSEEDWPFPQDDFMIGFEIKPNDLKGFGDNLGNCLVYIGKDNPFVRGQLKPVKWEETDPKDFPATPADAATYSRINATLREFIFPKNFSILKNKEVLVNAYKYQTGGYQYFIKDFFIKRKGYDEVIARRLLIYKAEPQELVTDKTYVLSDGVETVPLNYLGPSNDKSVYQWTGNLFKNKPPVIFGFAYFSFGCPEIIFLSKAEGEISINCDNRH